MDDPFAGNLASPAVFKKSDVLKSHSRALVFQPTALGHKAYISQHDSFLSRIVLRSPFEIAGVEVLITHFKNDQKITNVIPLEVITGPTFHEVDLGLFPRHLFAYGEFLLRVRSEQKPEATLETYPPVEGTENIREACTRVRFGGFIITLFDGTLEVSRPEIHQRI